MCFTQFLQHFSEPFIEFSEKRLVAIKRIIRTCNLLCRRPKSHHTTTKSQETNKIIWPTLMLQWFVNSMKVLLYFVKIRMNSVDCTVEWDKSRELDGKHVIYSLNIWKYTLFAQIELEWIDKLYCQPYGQIYFLQNWWNSFAHDFV